jgi:aryl-alcohol dehydrogenase-like predicted oxidoreductase
MIRRTGYMRQLKLNKSGIIIPVMSLGTWAFGGDAIWGKTDEMQAIDTARRAVEMGIVLLLPTEWEKVKRFLERL